MSERNCCPKINRLCNLPRCCVKEVGLEEWIEEILNGLEEVRLIKIERNRLMRLKK
jgi:hypothetical protein